MFFNKLIHLFSLFPWQWIYFPFPWYKSLFYFYWMISYFFHWHSFTHFLSKDMNLLVKPLRNQFLGLFFGLCCFYLLHPKSPISLLFSLLLLFSLFLDFSSPLFSVLSFLVSFLFPPFYLLPSASTTLTFIALVSIAFYISLDTLSLSLLLFSSQSQDCGKQAITFLNYTPLLPSNYIYLHSLPVSLIININFYHMLNRSFLIEETIYIYWSFYFFQFKPLLSYKL